MLAKGMGVEMVNEIWAVISRSQRFRAGTVVAAWRGRGAAKAGGRLTLGDAGPRREAGEGTLAPGLHRAVGLREGILGLDPLTPGTQTRNVSYYSVCNGKPDFSPAEMLGLQPERRATRPRPGTLRCRN